MKKSAVLAVLLLGVFSPLGAPAEDARPLRIGVVFPFTGKQARQAQLGKMGIELALGEFGKTFWPEIFYEDDQSDPKMAVAAFAKLEALNKVEAVLTMGSPSAMALLPMANRAQVVLLSMVVVPKYSAPGDFGFRLMGSAVGFSRRMIELLVKEMGRRRIALVYVEDGYGLGYAEYLEAELKKEGVLAAAESYLPGTDDFRSLLLKLKAAKPDALIIASWAMEAGVLLRQAKESGIDPGVIACPGACDNPDLITGGAGATDSVVVLSSASKTTPEREKVLRERFNEAPTSVVLRLYDALVMLREAAKKCSERKETRGECLKSALALTRDLPGSSYPLALDANGDIVDQYQLKLIRHGAFVTGKVENQALVPE